MFPKYEVYAIVLLYMRETKSEDGARFRRGQRRLMPSQRGSISISVLLSLALPLPSYVYDSWFIINIKGAILPLSLQHVLPRL